ncbi:translation initiation factor IF-2 subunit beta [Salinarchaeum chitinilyticum]
MEYEDKLNRALEETPDIGDESARLSVPDPEVRQEGNVTVYENFQDTVTTLSRDPEHVLKALQNEVGTSAHIDESGRARLTGSFSERRISDALDAYTEEFVTCSECGLPDTRLEKEKGTLVVRCEACGAISPTSA